MDQLQIKFKKQVSFKLCFPFHSIFIIAILFLCMHGKNIVIQWWRSYGIKVGPTRPNFNIKTAPGTTKWQIHSWPLCPDSNKPKDDCWGSWRGWKSNMELPDPFIDDDTAFLYWSACCINIIEEQNCNFFNITIT